MKRTEHTQPWLDALRSGEFPQITGTMKDDYGYCCLGVAAKIIGADGDLAYDAVKESFGLAEGEMWGLISANDDGDTFPQIADEIEKMLDER